MRARGKQSWWIGMLLCGAAAAACGQELVLPQKPAVKSASAAGAPSEGVTGASGAPDDAAAGPRLPVATEPVFTTFGGAGGESGTDHESSAGAAGATEQSTTGGSHGGAAFGGTGGSKASGGGAGGAKPNGGSGGVGGTKPSASGGASGSGAAGTMSGLAGNTEAGSGGGSGTPGLAALMFSEYVEGSGSFKALEIYALEASSLEGCELQTYFNGKLEPSRLALHGELAQGDVQVLCSSALATAQPSICDRSTSLTFNGDDALALSCDGTLLDVIGQIGVDPGDAWGVDATADHTLRRRCSVTQGHTDGSQPFEIDAEWLTLGVDTFSDLGKRDCALP